PALPGRHTLLAVLALDRYRRTGRRADLDESVTAAGDADTGGTFTDAFVADQHNRLAAAKTPSTPPDFAEGFLNAIDDLAAELDVSVRDLLADTYYIVHGTTSTLNAIVTG